MSAEQRSLRVHHPDACAGEHCPFHNPSDHRMRDWKVNIRESTLVERLCPHGIGHPDPDSVAYMDRRDGYEEGDGCWGVHGCDGCCWDGYPLPDPPRAVEPPPPPIIDRLLGAGIRLALRVVGWVTRP